MKQENEKLMYTDSFGDTFEVFPKINMYRDNDNLYLGLDYYDEDLEAVDAYCDITVNIHSLPYLHSALDLTYGGEQKLKLLQENGFGELTGQMLASGFCTYPVFKFNEAKLREIDPGALEAYAKAHGRENATQDSQVRYAYIPEIKDGVVFSDPLYDKDVWCQYRKEFTDRNWFMKLDTHDGEYDTLNFQLVLGRPTMVNSVDVKETGEGYTMQFPEYYSVSDAELGMDTARIYLGSMKNFKEFGDSASFKTGTDGSFGDLFVYTVKGDDAPAGFILLGAFDKDFVTEKELFGQLLASFDGKELAKEEFVERTSDKVLANRMLLANELRIAQSVTDGPVPDGPEKEKGPKARER